MKITFSKILRELRLEKKLTQKQLGDVFSVTSSTISDWETRGYEPSYQTLAELAEYFSVTIGQLLGVEEY